MSSTRAEDLTIVQGTDATFRINIQEPDGTAKDVTSQFFYASLKKSHSAADSSKIDFTTAVIDAANGIISISLDSDTTATLDHNARYVYDCFMTAAGNNNIQSILEGKIFVKPSVTRVD